MSELPGTLTLEQEFQLKILKDQVRNLSHEDAQDYVVEVSRQLMVKENLMKHLIKQDLSAISTWPKL